MNWLSSKHNNIGHYSHVNISSYVAGYFGIDGVTFVGTEQCALRCRAVRVRFISLFAVCGIEFDIISLVNYYGRSGVSRHLTAVRWAWHATELFNIFRITFVTKFSVFYNFDKVQFGKIFISILFSHFIRQLLVQYLTRVNTDELTFRNVVQTANTPSTFLRFEQLKINQIKLENHFSGWVINQPVSATVKATAQLCSGKFLSCTCNDHYIHRCQ